MQGTSQGLSARPAAFGNNSTIRRRWSEIEKLCSAAAERGLAL